MITTITTGMVIDPPPTLLDWLLLSNGMAWINENALFVLPASGPSFTVSTCL
jgi:hypothetical protein